MYIDKIHSVLLDTWCRLKHPWKQNHWCLQTCRKLLFNSILYKCIILLACRIIGAVFCEVCIAWSHKYSKELWARGWKLGLYVCTMRIKIFRYDKVNNTFQSNRIYSVFAKPIFFKNNGFQLFNPILWRSEFLKLSTYITNCLPIRLWKKSIHFVHQAPET